MGVKCNLKWMLVKHGITQKEMAESIGVNENTLTRIGQGGDYEPRVGLALKIANKLGSKVEDIWEIDDPGE